VPPEPGGLSGNPLAYNRRGRVTDYNDAEQVVLGDFPGGLKDVNTENPDVRDRC
jgi:alpha-amylase